MNASELIPHTIEGAVVYQRVDDGYFNATAMCAAAGKLIGHYRENKQTVAFLEELAGSIGIPIDRLVVSIMDGANDLRGTWVHPYVAVHLAQWLSPRFAVQVSKWVYHWSKELKHTAGTLNRLVRAYLAQGRTEEWIRERIGGMLTRRELTDQWRNGGAMGRSHFGILTRMLHIRAIGMGPKEHRILKGIKPHQSLRDNCTELELLLIHLGERSTIEIALANEARGYKSHKSAVLAGGGIAETARKQLEKEIDGPVASRQNFLPKGDAPRAIDGPAAG
jgi:hypothetical protein